MKARMSDLVRTPSGEVVTLGELADRGEVTFSMTDRFYKRGNGIRTAYFADHVSGAGSWEISKLAYESRTQQTTTVFPAGGSAVGQKNLSVAQPGKSKIMDRALRREENEHAS